MEFLLFPRSFADDAVLLKIVCSIQENASCVLMNSLKILRVADYLTKFRFLFSRECVFSSVGFIFEGRLLNAFGFC